MEDPELDGLLEPTLTEADDLTGFDRPWNPWNLLLVVFFGGPLFGGALAAWNFRKLGMPRAVLPALGGFVLAHFVFFGLFLLTTDIQHPTGEDEVRERLLRNAGRFLWVLVGLVVAAAQRRRFRVYEGGGEEPGRVLPLGIAALVLNLLTIEYQVMLVAVVLGLTGWSS